MRLSFGNGEHADFVVEGGTISLGSADGNTVVLPSRDVAAWHARMTIDPRGVVLDVLDPAARTHVNARPVREKALLRSGDIVCLGKVMVTLKVDRDDDISTVVPAESPQSKNASATPARVMLRGVSGSHFGKSIAVNQRVAIGRGADCGLVIDDPRLALRHATMEQVDEAIYLRQTGDAGGALVNGVHVRNAVVHPGDQISFEGNQFIVEAPGLPLRGEASAREAHAITETMSAVQIDDAATATQSQGAIWWLIGAAALIALGLFVLIQRG